MNAAPRGFWGMASTRQELPGGFKIERVAVEVQGFSARGAPGPNGSGIHRVSRFAQFTINS